MAPPVLYAKSGDVHVAYTLRGSGPDLVWCPGSLSHQELWPQIPEFAGVVDGPAQFSRVIFFDKRGTGMSDRPASRRSRSASTTYARSWTPPRASARTSSACPRA